MPLSEFAATRAGLNTKGIAAGDLCTKTIFERTVRRKQRWLYKHGVYVNENATSLTAPVTGNAGLQVVVGTAP